MTIDYPVFNETGPPSPPGTIYPALRGGMRLDLDFRISPITGRKVLHFPFKVDSDIHIWSEFSRAKRGCMVLRDIESDKQVVNGDLAGGIEAMEMETYGEKSKWHRQVVASFIQKMSTYVGGNHEVGLERHLENPISIFGMTLCREADHTDPKGRHFLIRHGHLYRYAAMEKAHEKARKFFKKFRMDIGDFDPEKQDTFGNRLMDLGNKIDLWLQEGFLKLEKASITVFCKRIFKKGLNKLTGVLAEAEEAIDQSPYDGELEADTHIPQFHTTPGGKLLINDGSWCDHVNYAVHDKHGNWALITHHRHHMNVEMEDGNKYAINYQDIGCAHFAEDPVEVENEYTAQADHLMRLGARMWPAKDRQGIYQKVERQEREVERLCRIVGVDPAVRFESGQIVVGPDVSRQAAKELRAAEKDLAALEFIRNGGNLPPRSPRQTNMLPFILPRPAPAVAYEQLAMAGD
jgi:hypothetical protein